MGTLKFGLDAFLPYALSLWGPVSGMWWIERNYPNWLTGSVPLGRCGIIKAGVVLLQRVVL